MRDHGKTPSYTCCNEGIVPGLSGCGINRRLLGHDQIMAIEKHQRFQRLAPLELSKDELEGMPQRLRGNGIEALPHPRVTGHAVNAIDGLQVSDLRQSRRLEKGGTAQSG